MSIFAPEIYYLKIEWWNDCDLGNIVYQDGFIQRIFLAVDAGKPSYPLIEEGYNDEYGEFIRSFQKWKKQYKLRFVLYEYQLDAITLIPIHDNIWIYLQNGQSARVTDMTINSPEWSDCGCFATIEIDFTIGYIKNACCENKSLIPENQVQSNLIEIDITVSEAGTFKMDFSGTSGKNLYVNWDDGNNDSYTMQGTSLANIFRIDHIFQPGSYTIEIDGDIDNITIMQFRSGLSEFPLDRLSIPQEVSLLERIEINNDDNDCTFVINSAITTLEWLDLIECSLDTMINIDSFVNLRRLSLSDNDLSTAQVNTILCSVDANNISTSTGRVIFLTNPDGVGSNQAPDATGCNGTAAKTSLQSKGWTVNTV